MSISKNSDGKIMLSHDGVSYLCASGDHKNCGGFSCACVCHKNNETI